MPYHHSAENEEGESRKRSREEILEETYAGLKDFLQTDKMSERPVSDEEKKQLKRLIKRMNFKGSKVYSDMCEPQTILKNWKSAVNRASNDNQHFTAKDVVEKFLSIHLEGLKLPTEENERRANVVGAVCEFINISLFPGTLAGRIESVFKGRTHAIREKLDMYPCPILCSNTRIKVFATKLSIVDEWPPKNPLSPAGNPAMDASKQIESLAASKAQGRANDHPIVIGGDSGSGKTIFSVLAPGLLLAEKDVSAEDMKRSALVIYGYASEVARPLRNTISAADAALQRAKDEKAENVDDLRKERNDAASAFLQALVGVALNWKGELTLPEEKKYAHLFIVVDELSSEKEVFRSLLVGGEEQQYILSFTEKFAHETQLICCATGGRSVLDSSGTSLGNYDVVHMWPSEHLFQLLLRQGDVKDKVIGNLLRNRLLAAAVQNRRIATYAAEIHLGKRSSNIETKSKNGSDLVAHASFLACSAMLEYTKVNGLSKFSQETATNVMLEGLRRLLLWDPKAQPDVGKLFASMGECSPLKLGTFSDFVSDVGMEDRRSVPTEMVRVVVTTAQLVMAALRYGASSAIMQATPAGFESMSAHMFALFLNAMRVVARWDGSEEDRVLCLEKTRRWKDEQTLRKFASALRGTEEVPPVSLAAFLRALDDEWRCGDAETRREDAERAKTRRAEAWEAKAQEATAEREKIQRVAAQLAETQPAVAHSTKAQRENAQLAEEKLTEAQRKEQKVADDQQAEELWANADAVDPEEVMLTHRSVELPEELPHKLQPGTEEHAQEFEATFKEMQTEISTGAAVVWLNAGEACYADFIAVCGDVLFLARCKDCPTVGFGETDQVREELARMGFMSADGTGDSFPAKTSSEDWEECAALTHSLMKTFGCRIAVPLFYLSERTSDVELSAKGREVIAAGHGWRGPVPFVRVSATFEKSFRRKKIPTPIQPPTGRAAEEAGRRE